MTILFVISGFCFVLVHDDLTTTTLIKYWLGDPPPMSENGKPSCEDQGNGWLYFPDTGIATCWQGIWMGRWDLSPLGYLRTAAHGIAQANFSEAHTAIHPTRLTQMSRTASASGARPRP